MSFMKMLWDTTPPAPEVQGCYWEWANGDNFSLSINTANVVMGEGYNDEIPYYWGVGKLPDSNQYRCIVLSQVSGRTAHKFNGNQRTTRGSLTDPYGNTWYWAGFEDNMSKPYYTDCIFSDITGKTYSSGAEMASDMVQCIFNEAPLRANYQVGQEYTFTIDDIYYGIGDYSRRIIGLFLVMNPQYYINDNTSAIAKAFRLLCSAVDFVAGDIYYYGETKNRYGKTIDIYPSGDELKVQARYTNLGFEWDDMDEPTYSEIKGRVNSKVTSFDNRFTAYDLQFTEPASFDDTALLLDFTIGSEGYIIEYPDMYSGDPDVVSPTYQAWMGTYGYTRGSMKCVTSSVFGAYDPRY